MEPRSKTTEKRTLGYAVIDFSTDVLGLTLLPWQQWLLIHALELLPDGSFRFRTVVVLVARQNGKSTLSMVLSLFFMYVLARRLVIGTAQDLDVAEEIWQAAVDIAEETDELAEMIDKVVKVNGKKALNLTTGERYKVKAANRRAGRGLSGDLILLDELREHQTWLAWGAITKTTMARAAAMIWALSNAGDQTSVVLRYLRLLAHIALGNPDGLDDSDIETPLVDDEDAEEDPDSLGLFEWSAPPGCETNDREALAQANPAMGYTITERAIMDARRTDPDAVFRTEVMCQWVDRLTNPLFGADKWETLLDETSQIQGAANFGIDATPDLTHACISAGGKRKDGLMHVEDIDHHRGTSWVVGRILDLQARWGGQPVAIPARGPAASLIPELEAAGVELLKLSTADEAKACGWFFTAVQDGTIRHGGRPDMEAAVAGALKRAIGDEFIWSRKLSTVDISPLNSATYAAWAAQDGLPADYDPLASLGANTRGA